MSVAVMILCCFSGFLNGATILSENFDALTPGPSVTSARSFSAIGGTDIDITGGINGSYFPALCAMPESGNCVDLDGSGVNPQGQLRSNMLFAAGSYLLTFDLIGSQRGNSASTTVTFGDYNRQFALASSDVISGIVVNQPVTLSAPGFLLFVSNTPGFQGNLLDNVVVSAASTAVPEPSSLTLMGLVLLGCIKGRSLREKRAGPKERSRPIQL